MTENYIVLKGKRYDILLPEEHNCDKYKTCKECPLDSKRCTNIIDFINDTFDTDCEQGVVIINHEDV